MDTALFNALHKAYLSPFSLQSNFARENAQTVAALASMGLISTKVSENTFGTLWRCTFEGVLKLTAKGLI